MKQFGLIGFPLTHSFSKKYFEKKFAQQHISGCSYSLFELPFIEQLPNFIRGNKELRGLNVTIPYKQTVIPYLNQLSSEAQLIGAVNCIDIRNGQTIGYNTDVYGFEKSLLGVLPDSNYHAFVLGSGGSSLAVQYVLKKIGVSFHVVSRTASETAIQYRDIESLIQPDSMVVYINCTPVGMYPYTDFFPAIPYHRLRKGDILFDLVYNPEQTVFLKRGQQSGAIIKNGLEMLELQAERSWEIWTG